MNYQWQSATEAMMANAFGGTSTYHPQERQGFKKFDRQPVTQEELDLLNGKDVKLRLRA